MYFASRRSSTFLSVEILLKIFFPYKSIGGSPFYAIRAQALFYLRRTYGLAFFTRRSSKVLSIGMLFEIFFTYGPQGVFFPPISEESLKCLLPREDPRKLFLQKSIGILLSIWSPHKGYNSSFFYRRISVSHLSMVYKIHPG